jgi:hypothetical protein
MWATRLPIEFWFATKVPVIPLLQELHDFVIRQNECRLPKWKFKFADDLAIQIHPKLTQKHALLFEGLALQAENLSVKLFTEPKQLRQLVAYWRLGFQLFRDQGDVHWSFTPKSAGRGRGCQRHGLRELRQRVVEVLRPERFAKLDRTYMLSPHCLCCGKGLTDPVSIARWIGPECWGSASTHLPQIFKAEAPDLFQQQELAAHEPCEPD